MKQTASRRLVEYIARTRMVKYVQALELTTFLITGFMVGLDFMAAGIFLVIGIALALLAGESAIREYEIKRGIEA